jgi:hypothetical protein
VAEGERRHLLTSLHSSTTRVASRDARITRSSSNHEDHEGHEVLLQHDALEPCFQDRNSEIDQQPTAESRRLQVGHHLRLMDVVKSRNRLQFNDDQIPHDKVRPLPVDLNAAIRDGDGLF